MMKPIPLQSRVDGNSIIVVLMVIATLSTAVVCALNLTSGIARNTNRTDHYRDSVEIADGALDYLYAHWVAKSKVNRNTQLKGEAFKDIPPLTSAHFPGLDSTFRLSDVSIDGLGLDWKELPKDASVPPAYGMNSGAMTYYYQAKAHVTTTNINGTPVDVTAKRILEKQIESPWMYAIFYTDLLEIHPGPEFHVTGWVHTNDDLYTAHNTLWFESKVTFVGDWINNYAPNDGAHGGKPTMPNFAEGVNPARDESHDPMGMTPKGFDTADTNPNNDGYRELIEKPAGGFDDPLSGDRYYNQADVKVTIDGTDSAGNPVLTIRNHDDAVITSNSSGTDLALYQTFRDAVTVGDKIQDNREGKEVRLMTVDMSKVNTAMQPGGSLYGKMQGVVYVSDQTATSSSRGGVRLKNGGTMPPGGLTLVSDNPVYIQGDYNTGSNGTLQPNSNEKGGDPAKNIVDGYQKQSCAVVGDAVMVLSNSWNDANSYEDVNKRQASPTTVNSAIISGIVPTGEYGNNYSGGAENFPRFMENWGNNTAFTYYGSMVELYKSKQNIGAWGRGNVYVPPKRNWHFERQFYTDPPPGTLKAIKFEKGLWTLE